LVGSRATNDDPNEGRGRGGEGERRVRQRNQLVPCDPVGSGKVWTDPEDEGGRRQGKGGQKTKMRTRTCVCGGGGGDMEREGEDACLSLQWTVTDE